MYYGIPLRRRRLRRFYAMFVPRGGLCFDVGANAGNRTKAFSDLGARVVSIEPQPHFARLLRRFFAGNTRVTVVDTAVGDAPGAVTLFLNERHPTLATTRGDWVDALRDTELFRNERWSTSVEVPQRTLDDLIGEFGEPDFVKIDVEGNEAGVLAGLTRPLRALSFEFIPAAPGAARDCVRRLRELGDYRYNYSFSERMHLEHDTWLSPDELLDMLGALPETGSSGDAYAVRTDALDTLIRT
ncbi:MAG: FkbM family methyltransferase [bacterium]